MYTFVGLLYFQLKIVDLFNFFQLAYGSKEGKVLPVFPLLEVGRERKLFFHFKVCCGWCIQIKISKEI